MGCFWTWQNGVFWGLFFEVLILKRFVFGVSGIVWKVLKMLVFPQFFGVFLGWLIVVHLGLEGLGVFVFLVFIFLFCVAFVSVLFALFLALWLDVVVFLCFFFWLFLLLFCLFCFVFFGGFKGQVRWPKGPPHLALNPPYFICFGFFCLFFCFFFFIGFFGGFKGQVRWPKGPPHLALNPPYFICFCLFFCFFLFFLVSLSLLLLEKKPVPSPPLKRAFFVYFFWVSLSFSLALFHFLLFLSLSLSLSLFLCLSLVLFLFPSLLFFISVSGYCFSFLFCLLSSFKLFFGFCCSACCLALFRIIIFHLFLLCIFCLPFVLVFCFACFVFFFLFLVFWETKQKHLQKNGNWKNSKNIKCRKKTDTLTRAVSTIVFTNSVIFLFLCFFKFCIFAENTIKIGVSAPPPPKKKQKKKNKKINKFYKLKTGPSIS